MNKHAVAPHWHIVDQVKALHSDSLTGIELFRALNGIHPIEIKKALLSAGELGLLEETFKGLCLSGSILREITQDDNPVLSFWPFTSDSAQEISCQIASNDSVALLGSPTIFGPLKQRPGGGRVTLFDSDDYLFREGTIADFVQCDVVSGMPVRYENQFDAVFGDPPWYADEYCEWLKVAVRLTRPGGLVYFVLFPPNVRPSAVLERKKILETAGQLLEEVQITSIIARYATPSFEQVELIKNGIAPVSWRTAQIFVGRVPLNKVTVISAPRVESPERWTERRIGCGRIFVRNEAADASQFLETANGGSRFLSSPSRRDPARRRSNIVSSRGHGLCCKYPQRFLDFLDTIQCPSDLENHYDLDDASATLFTSVVNDLWPRFIELNVDAIVY